MKPAKGLKRSTGGQFKLPSNEVPGQHELISGELQRSIGSRKEH